jgi:hypothetical protein
MRYPRDPKVTLKPQGFIISQVWYSAASGIVTSDRRVPDGYHVH